MSAISRDIPVSDLPKLHTPESGGERLEKHLGGVTTGWQIGGDTLTIVLEEIGHRLKSRVVGASRMGSVLELPERAGDANV